MNDNNIIEIDITKLLLAIWNRIVIVILATVLLAAVGLCYARFAVTPLYQASTTMYVNNSDSVGNNNANLSASDLSAAKSLVDTYSVILKSRTTLNEVIRIADVDYSYEQISKMIDASSVNGTENLQVVVTSADPAEAMLIANTVAKVLPNRIAEIVDGSSVRIVDYAVEPTGRSSPSYTKYTAISGLIGLLISCMWIIIRELTDNEIHGEDYLQSEYPDVPILAVIPDLREKGTDGYSGYGGYGGYGNGDKRGGSNI